MSFQTRSIADTQTLPQRHIFPLSRGTMTLDVTTSKADVTGIIKMAERQNPKRAFLFVSTVLGRHIPVPAASHRHILQALAQEAAQQIDTARDVLVMGYAETAVGLGAGVYDALRQSHMLEGRAAYLPTTRHPEGRPVWAGFSEDHSHATAHNVLVPEDPEIRDVAFNAPTLVLVDDETTTGKTFANLLAALAAAGRTFERICLVTLTDWSAGEVRKSISELPFCQQTDVRSVSLVEGRWSWSPAAGLAEQTIPASKDKIKDARIDACAGSWRAGIMGGTSPETDELMRWLPSADQCGSVLIIGTGEYVWQPFRVAEMLEEGGYQASFLATTRSPVLLGETITRKAIFPDHYGIGVPMYLHNVDPQAWGRIVLLNESEDLSGLTEPLREYLSTFAVMTPAGRIHQFNKGKLCA